MKNDTIYLLHLTTEHAEELYNLVDDEEVKRYFSSFNGEKDEIISQLVGLNQNLRKQQYWGIFNTDRVLVGYISIKANLDIIKTQDPEIDTDALFEMLNESPVQGKKREERELLKAPFAVDFVTHRDFRTKGLAFMAIELLKDYAKSAGITALYFDVHQENIGSKNLMTKIGAVHLKDSDNLLYPSGIYELSLKEGPKEIADFISSHSLERQKPYNMARQMISQVPELFNQREILIELFERIFEKIPRIETCPDIESCCLKTEFNERHMEIGTKRRENPLTLIFSIAHEYGHLLQPLPSELEKKPFSREKYLREAQAWDLAEDFLRGFPLYLYHWPEFIRFRNSRLESYLP
ncbi:Protein N-acetyltransferase, RimJ/RimL family [Pedobacter suwonensis]|uniref:Protein N-acetyltransferase, RimJ/RimL family n=1 Tax=Pedobacter suwonensis TaxID=332999 RepID=A0A1I0SFS9_9SPHI|nr:GNAT family N-acetyltransferase [Pedobacter suwonensis]SFA38297.1 Protein N-acetyltransferase, RimJ/RimL family [Pedobacter suwonensis]